MAGVHSSETTRRDADVSALRFCNLRDLGGLPTRHRAFIVRPRRFFRGSTPSRFGPAELGVLAALKLRTLIDLRTTAEVFASEDAPLAAVAQAVHLPLFETARQNWIAPADQSPRATAVRYLEMLDDSRDAVAAVVRQIAGTGATPFLVHCSAGRDRTGIVVACLLDLLEVTDEAIADDYSQSDKFDPNTGRAHAATIVEFLGLLRERHGSVQRMLATSGVTDGVIESLRRGLLFQQA